ncbi:hypothetical protein HDV06_004887 [Boothiomyces sp. JEL0866]|nr:hypothetical protein HDV06_004887 [Boothiomyces sp. JEL0866]
MKIYLNPFQKYDLKILEKFKVGDGYGIDGDSEDILLTDSLLVPTKFTHLKKVSSKWLEHTAKFNKKYDTKYYQPQNIFNGFIVHCHDLSVSDTAAIYAGVDTFGGQYRLTETQDVTHFVTSQPHLHIGKSCKVIIPEYFDDCFKLKRKCSESFYSNFEAEISPNEFDLNGHSVYLSCEIDESVKADLKRLKAKFSRRLEKSTIVITNTRDEVYLQARKLDLIVGNARWVTDIVNYNEFLDPQKVLYYPSEIVPEMKNLKISISNYTGQARLDIIEMINSIGCTFTPTLSTENTHLITNSAKGEKYQKSLQWNIHAVNHLWIEECKSQSKYLPESRGKYLVFNDCLQEMVNCTSTVLDLEHETKLHNDSLRFIELNEPEKENLLKKRKSYFSITGIRLQPDQLEYLKSQHQYQTDSLQKSSFLIAQKLCKTEKFLLAINYKKPIYSLRNNKLEPLLMPNTKPPLLKGYTIYYTKNVVPESKILKRLVTSAGGKCILIKQMDQVKDGVAIGSLTDDWLIQGCKKLGRKVYCSDLILVGILKQQLEFDNPDFYF